MSIPSLGTMRFSLNSKSVPNVANVGTDLITSRKIIYTPSVDIKTGLERTSINITCIDRNGKVVKKVTTDGSVDDPTDGNDPGNSGGTSGGDDLVG